MACYPNLLLTHRTGLDLSCVQLDGSHIAGKIKVVKELEKTFYGATEFSTEDNNSYLLTFAEDEK